MTSNFVESEHLAPVDASAGDAPPLTVEQAIANLRGSDLGLRYYAAWWLGRFRVAIPEAIDTLIDCLHDESDRTSEGGYPLRRNAARALGKLGDPKAVPGLIACLECDDFYVREAAVQSLGLLGDQSCIPALIQLLTQGLASPHPQSGKALPPQPYNAILEALGMLHATEATSLIERFLDYPIELVQYAAARAMFELTEEPAYAERLIQALSGDKLPLRRAVLADLGAIGYLPAAPAIAQTLAENSLKLISLKGLVEKQLALQPLPNLSPGAVDVMHLMDELL